MPYPQPLNAEPMPELLAVDWQAEIVPPDISDLITEDDTPVDNLIQEKQQRFLVECLYSSLPRDLAFVAAANIGLFYGLKRPTLVPDVLLSFGVTMPEDWTRKENRSYFVWEFGKPPDIAIEIVSNKKGNKLGTKPIHYAEAGVRYYVVFDPLQQISTEVLQVFGLREGTYYSLERSWMEQAGLGLTLWNGEYEGKQFRWLRWQNKAGALLLTGNERAEQEHQRAEQERQRADRLTALLRAQGIDPEDLPQT